MKQGFIILPIYEAAEGQYKGPRVYSVGRQFIGPDITAFRGQHFMFAEAKSKSHWSWGRRCNNGNGQWETGIDLNHYRSYLDLWRQLDKPSFYLFFLHKSPLPDPRDIARNSPKACPTGLFGGDLSSLWLPGVFCHIAPESQWGKGGMIYWGHKSLYTFATLEELQVNGGIQLMLKGEFHPLAKNENQP